MLNWLIEVTRLCRELRTKARDGLGALATDNADQVALIRGYMMTDANHLVRIWPPNVNSRIGDLRRHIGFAESHDFRDILDVDLPDIEAKAESYALSGRSPPRDVAFGDLLHPAVKDAALGHFTDGDYRNAVLDSVIAVFDLIKRRTCLDRDGETLINEAFSLEHPKLIFSDLDSESGRSDQKGFIQILKGVFQGIRNPKAHTLDHDLDATSAAQYMVLASALARRVSEAKPSVGQRRSKTPRQFKPSPEGPH
jgi:uncharacterized protein (TIGR02391 family)